jgi:hypothetical protein
MKYINFALKRAKNYENLISLIEGFNQDSNIQIKWYGSRRFKLDNYEGTVSLNDIWAAIEAKAKVEHEPAKLQKIINAINDLDNRANGKLQTYRLARKLNFIPHLLGCLFFNREKIKKKLVDLIYGSNNSASKPLIKMNLTNAQINRALFFQIHAGKFGGKHQDKFELKPALDFVHKYLVAKSKLKPDSTLNRMIGKLEKAQAFILALGNRTFEEKFKKEIVQAFKKQESLLVPGGWVGRGHNHVIYYEIIPTTQNQATIRFYDVTEHAEYQEFDHTKLRVLPYTELKGISREKLLSPELAKALKELLTYENYKPEDEKDVVRIPPVEPEGTLYVRNDIYQSLKNLLKPEDTLQPPEIPDQKPRFMTPPEQDVSPYRSLMAFLNAYLPLEEYKQLKVELKMESFSLWPQSFKGNHDIEDIRLLEKSLKKTSLVIEDLAKQKILDNAYVIKANDSLKSLASWLDANAQIKQAKFENIKFRKLGLPSFEPLSSPPNIVQELKNQKADSTVSNYSIAEEIYAYSKSIQAGNVEDLSKVEELCKNAWEQKEYLALQVGLERLIFDLPSDYKFWVRVFGTKEKAKQGIVQLGTLGDYYFKTCFMAQPAQTTSPEKYLTMAIIRVLQQHCLKSFSPGNEYYSGLWGSKTEFFPDEKISTKYSEYHKFNSSNKKSLFSKIFTSDHPGMQTTLFYEGDHRLQPFKELFGPNFDQECQEKFLKWKKGKENNDINYIKYFASEELPDWLKALRNTHISVRAMLGMDLNVIADPQRPFEFKFSVETGYKQFRLHSKLTGIETPSIPSSLGEEWQIRREQRYLLLTRPFASPKIQTFYRRFVNKQDSYSQVSAEKEWLTVDPKEIKVDLLPEEYQELMQLFGEGYHGQYGIQTVQVLDYFARHPEKFKDPDYQTIFQKQFFHRESKDTLELYYWKTNIKKKAQEILMQNYRQMNLANEIQPAVFLLQMMRYLNAFLENKIPLDLTGEIRKLFTRPGLTLEEKSVIYAELIASLSEKKILSQQDKQDLLTGLAFLERYPVPSSWRDPKVEHSLRKAPHILSNTLVEYMSSMTSDQINQIIKIAYPDEPAKEWQCTMQGSDRVFTSGKSQYFPLRGVLFLESQQAKIRILPKAILESPDFERIFPNILMGQQVAPFIYSFQDSGREVLIKYDTESQEIGIEQNFDGQWATLVHKNKLLIETAFETISRLTSKSLVYHFSAWEIPSKKLLFLVDPKSGELKYRCVNDGPVLKITRLADQLQLNRPFDEVQKNGRMEKIPNSNFMRIEDPSYIHEWYEGDQLKEVELPRFGLTFKKDPKNPTCFHCHQLEGFSFNPEKSLPKLGIYSRYLLLENSSGQKKALFPHGCHLDVVMDSDEIQTLPYIVFDVTHEGLLQSPSMEENLFTAQVLTLVQEYSLAADYLQRFGQKLRPYSKKESHQLKAIASSIDQDPNAKALRTYASYLLLKNGERSRAELNKAVENFRYYLSNLKHATALKLAKEEEIFLLKTLLNRAFDPVFFLRLKELDPKSLSLLESPDLQTLMPKQQAVEFKFPSGNQLQSISFDRKKPEPINLNQDLFTRLELELKKKFFDYYELAKNANNQERHWLTNALSFNRNFNKSGLGNLLEVVLKYPDAFPSLPSENELKEYQWHAKILKIAEDLYAKNRKAFQQKTFNSIPPTLKDHEQISGEQGLNLTKVAFHFSYNEKSLPELAQGLFIATPQTRDPKTFIELKRLLENWKTNDNTFNSELQHQIDDLDALEKLPPPTAYKLKESSLEKIETLLVKDVKRKKQLSALEQEIITLANHAPQVEEDLLYHELQLMAGTKKALTLNALIINFGQQDPGFLKKNNPALTDEEIARLYGKICDYLLQVTHEQQRVRSLKILELVKASKKGSLEETELIQLLGESLLANRHFNPQEMPVYLVFEYYLNIKIRQAQIEKISKIQPNTVTQMLMGDGKTTVLYQLEGLLRADGTNTSLLVLPEFLFASVATYSQEVHLNCFGKKLHTFHFDRNTAFTQNSLEIFLDNLNNATNNRECIITTSKSIACLILKYIELSVEEGSAQDRNEELMEEIFTLLEVNGYPLIDEIDTILRVLHEISFSIGKLVPVDECEYITIEMLYDILYTDPEIKNLAYFESDPFPKEGAPAFTEDLYDNKIKPKLVEAFIDRLQHMKFESELLEEKLQNFGHSLSENDKALLRYYLSQDEVHLAEAQAYFDSLDPDVQNIVALAGEEICHFLPYTLNMNSDENYGFNGDGDLFATPFASADVPQVGSEFKNSHITMNTTFQMYIKKAFP